MPKSHICFFVVTFCVVVFAGFMVLITGPRHPAVFVGTWNAGPGVTVTFAADGALSLNGEGAAPAFLAVLHNVGEWDVVAGDLQLSPRNPGNPANSARYDYAFDPDIDTLQVTIASDGPTFRLSRIKP